MEYNTSYGSIQMRNLHLSTDERDFKFDLFLTKLQTTSTTKLCKVSITDSDIINDFIMRLCEGLDKCESLTELDLRRNRLGPESAHGFAELLRNNKSLKSLLVQGNRLCGVWIKRSEVQGTINRHGVQDLLDAIVQSESLKFVDLSSNYLGLVPENEPRTSLLFKKILAVLQRNRSLKYFNIIDNQLEELFLHINELARRRLLSSQIRSICGVEERHQILTFPWSSLSEAETQYLQYELSSHSQLHTVDLCSSSTDSHILSLVRNITSYPFIKHLLLSNSNIRDSHSNKVAECIRDLLTDPACPITCLDLSEHNQWTSNNFMAIGEGVAGNSRLVELRLGSCSLRHQGAVAIANALRSNQSLRVLDLERNQIGDSGAEVLFEALVHNSSLQKLNLSENRIALIGCVHITSLLLVNQTLLVLTMDRNPLSLMQTQSPLADDAEAPSDMWIMSTYVKRLERAWIWICDNLDVIALSQRPQRPYLTLSLQTCSLVGEQSMKIWSMATQLRNPTATLLTLELSGNRMCMDLARALCEAVLAGQMPLVRLGLQRTQLNATECQTLCPMIASSTTLQYLDLSENSLGLEETVDENGEVIGRVHGHGTVKLLWVSISESRSLRQVILRCNDLFGVWNTSQTEFSFSPDCLQAISSLLIPRHSLPLPAVMRPLVSIDILRNHFPPPSQRSDYEALQAILDDMLTKMKSQTHFKSLCGFSGSHHDALVDFRNLGLHSIEAKILATDLILNQYITSIDLSGNLINDEGATCLARALECSSSLRSCRVDRAGLTVDGMALLERAKEAAYWTRVSLHVLLEADFRCLDRRRFLRGIGPISNLLSCVWGHGYCIKQFEKYL